MKYRLKITLKYGLAYTTPVYQRIFPLIYNVDFIIHPLNSYEYPAYINVDLKPLILFLSKKGELVVKH